MNTESMRKMVAVFRNTTHAFTCVLANNGDDENWTLDEYVRISDWHTVDFKALSLETLTQAELAALSELRARTVAEFTEKLNYIDGRMANLRALTGPVQS